MSKRRRQRERGKRKALIRGSSRTFSMAETDRLALWIKIRNDNNRRRIEIERIEERIREIKRAARELRASERIYRDYYRRLPERTRSYLLGLKGRGVGVRKLDPIKPWHECLPPWAERVKTYNDNRKPGDPRIVGFHHIDPMTGKITEL